MDKEIEEKIAELEKRIAAGEDILSACKKQLRTLKQKVKEYRRLKVQVSQSISSAADGDL